MFAAPAVVGVPGGWGRAGMARVPMGRGGRAPAQGTAHTKGTRICSVRGRYGRAKWLWSRASTDYSAVPGGSQEPQCVCFTILLLLKDRDRQLYVWHGWHIQHKAWLDLIYIHIKCQETVKCLPWIRDEACICVCLVCVIVFSFSLVLHKNVSNNFLTKVPFLISVLSNM